MVGTITTDLALVNATGGDAEVITNWTVTAAWSGVPAVSNDVYLQGSNAINARASSGTPGTIALYWDHLTTGTANLDLTTASYHIFYWIKCFSLPSMEKKVRGGIGVSISSTAGVVKVGTDPWSGITDSKTWFVTGSDEDPNQGWICHVVDPASTADFSTGTPVMTSVDRIGIRAGALQTVGGGAVKPFPVIWDALRYGTGLTVKDGTVGTPVKFEDLYTTDSTTSNQWGIVGKNTGIYFFAGKINIGTAAQTAVTVLTDTNQVIVYRDQSVAAGFYEIILAGAASFNTTLTLGSISGSLTSAGCTIKGTGLTTRRLIAPVIVSGGTATYVVGNILTVSGGTGTAATMKVIAVSAGVITELRMETAGVYSVPPTGTLTLTGGGGSGATCTATVTGGSIWTLSASAANQTMNLYACTLQQMKSAALTTTSTLDGCIISDSGEITVGGATIKNCLFQDLRTTTPISATYQLRVTTTTPILTSNRYVNCATALLWDRNADVSSKIDGSAFTSGGTGHGIEFGTNTPTTLTFTNVTFTGYGGTPGSNATPSTGSTDAAVYNNSGKTITITISGGTTPAVRNGASSTTVIVTGVVTLKTTVLNNLGVAIQNVRVAIYKTSDNSELMNSLTDASGIATTTFSYVSDTAIYIRARKTSTGITRYFNNDSSGTIISTGFTSTITLLTDTIASP